jgi:hypothetical protein
MSIHRTVPVLALLSTMPLAGCAALEGLGDDPSCHGGKCDDPRDDPASSFERLAVLSETVVNGDSLPSGFAVVDGAVLFFSAARKGLYRTDGTPDGTGSSAISSRRSIRGSTPFQGSPCWTIGPTGRRRARYGRQMARQRGPIG